MRAIIIDDNQETVRQIKNICSRFCKAVDLIAVGESVKEGILQVKQIQPQFVLLRAQLNTESGFKLLEHCNAGFAFETIVFHHDCSFAIEAFRYFASDYLLEPIDKNALIDAIQKVERRLQNQLHSKSLKDSIQQSDKIALPTAEGFIFVRQQEIVRCEANGNYTQVHLKTGKSILITRTLKHYEQLLDSTKFFRSHKSHLINLNYIRRFNKGKRISVETLDGNTIEVSARKRDALLHKLALR